MKQNLRAAQRPRFAKAAIKRQRRLILSIVVALALLIAGGWGIFRHVQQQEQQTLSPYSIRGCVIDQEDGIVNFQDLAKQKVKFVYLNATTGATYFDDSFNTNYDRLRATNLKVGVVHNFSFERSAVKQLQYISRKVKSNTGQLPVVIRVSYYGEDTAEKVDWKKQGPILADLVRRLANYYGQPVVIKTTPEIRQRLYPKYVKQSRFWLEAEKVQKADRHVEFVEYDDQRTLKTDRREIELPVSYFNGGRQEWQKY